MFSTLILSYSKLSDTKFYQVVLSYTKRCYVVISNTILSNV